jgi:signal transduction histidine kinase
MTLPIKILFIAIIAISFSHAQAKLLFYEGFNYSAGEELGQLSSGRIWGNDKNQFSIVSGSLSYPGLEGTSGNRLNVDATSPRLDSVRTQDGSWAKQTNGSLFISFLLRLHSFAEIKNSGDGTPLISIGDTFNNTELFSINLLNDGKVRLGVTKHPSNDQLISSFAFFNNGPGASLFVDGSTTYFVVAKYEWVEGASNDVLTLWVNPVTLGGNEIASGRVSVSAGADGARGAGRLTLCRGANVNLDELRIGQSWADVTPTVQQPRHWKAAAVLLAVGLIFASFWIVSLRRNVKERSAALKAQIAERQKAEQLRVLEQERARIAHDLHDELGADMTEIGMLATRAQGDTGISGERVCLNQLTDKAHQMVAKLEEIVWAMDPQHDSLEALVSYFSFFADRFLGLANIKLVIESSEHAANLTVEARARHQLFLVFKESLSNLVRHSGANEVRLVVRVDDRMLHVTVADNGCGLKQPDPSSGSHDGISNMRRRIEKLGGKFDIVGEAGQGTTVKFSVPLNT